MRVVHKTWTQRRASRPAPPRPGPKPGDPTTQASANKIIAQRRTQVGPGKEGTTQEYEVHELIAATYARIERMNPKVPRFGRTILGRQDQPVRAQAKEAQN